MIAKTMKSRLMVPNTLERLVRRHNLTNMTGFVDLHDKILKEFPRFSLDELKNEITLGEYQVDQCHGYLREHLKKNGDIRLFVCEKEIESESSRIVCCKFYSRHKSQTIYFAFVQYNKNELSWKSVIGWFCNCKVGSRTVGCCSHITAIIYYLAIGKYLPQNTYIDYSKSILNSKKISTKDLE